MGNQIHVQNTTDESFDIYVYNQKDNDQFIPLGKGSSAAQSKSQVDIGAKTGECQIRAKIKSPTKADDVIIPHIPGNSTIKISNGYKMISQKNNKEEIVGGAYIRIRNCLQTGNCLIKLYDNKDQLNLIEKKKSLLKSGESIYFPNLDKNKQFAISVLITQPYLSKQPKFQFMKKDIDINTSWKIVGSPLVLKRV